MALPKQVKVGGAFLEGSTLVVDSSVGDYILVINNSAGAALNGITITPDNYGAGDTFVLKHMSDVAGTGKTIQVLAKNIPNMGASASLVFDLPALQRINADQSLKLVYTNTATTAMNIYVISEWVGITVTS